MATTVPIPLTTLTVGTHTFGPTTVNTTDTVADLSIDRTVAGGLNATPTVTLDFALQYSTDGGTTWQFLAGATGLAGGTPATHPNLWSIGAGLPGVAFQLRGAITVHTTSVAVAGSLVIS